MKSSVEQRMMTEARLQELEREGWRLTRDGSTATARFVWEDPEDPESGWEIMVLHTAGHGSRFTLGVSGSGLTEREAADGQRLSQALAGALELMAEWQGELPSDED
jgi:hypothetical protein